MAIQRGNAQKKNLQAERAYSILKYMKLKSYDIMAFSLHISNSRTENFWFRTRLLTRLRYDIIIKGYEIN